MNIVAIIPARYASTRFPGKPLVNIGGKTMIQRVYEGAKSLASFTDVIVATDDERIEKHVMAFGGKVAMTSSVHKSGTERCAEVISGMAVQPDVVLNVQGDVPFISLGHLEEIIKCFQKSDTQIASLVKRISERTDLNNSNVPKVVFANNLHALYFSRNTIPYIRDVEMEKWYDNFAYYKHIGIYGYRSDILKEIIKLPEGKLERAENLEQLRWIENGYTIQLAETTTDSLSIDTPEDLSRVLAKMQGSKYLA